MIRSLLVFLFLSSAGFLLAGEKIDTVWFQKGDRITGEVTELVNNQVTLSTDDGGKVLIEWNRVDRIVILNPMRIVMDDGSIHFGTIHKGEEEGTGNVRPVYGDPFFVYLVRIVAMKQVEERFVERLSGLASSGLSYVKATEVLQFYLNLSLDYEAEKFSLGLFYDGNVSHDPLSGSTERQKGGGSYRQYLPNKWFVLGQFTAESNTELELDLRTGLLAVIGKSIVLTNRMRWDMGLGILANREQSSALSAYNLEGVVGGEYSVFISDAPDITFSLEGQVIPSLNDPGRIRTEINSNLRWEVFSDFYLKWTLYHSFDSRPLSSEAARVDWAISMLGVEYKL